MKHLTATFFGFIGLVLSSYSVVADDSSNSETRVINQPPGLPDTMKVRDLLTNESEFVTPIAYYENNRVYALRVKDVERSGWSLSGVYYAGFTRLGGYSFSNESAVAGFWANRDSWAKKNPSSRPNPTDVTLQGVFSESVKKTGAFHAGYATINVDASTNTMTIVGPSALEGRKLGWVDAKGDSTAKYLYSNDAKEVSDLVWGNGKMSQDGNIGIVEYYDQNVSGNVLAVK